MGLLNRESSVINGAPGGTRFLGHTETPDNGGIDAPTTSIGPGRALTVTVNVDVSDALTGLKALRREADAAVRSLKALDEALSERDLSEYSPQELADELARRTNVFSHEVVRAGYRNVDRVITIRADE